MADPELIEVFAAAHLQEAILAQDMLQNAGIKTQLVGGQLEALGGALPFGHVTSPRLWVRCEDAARAIALLEHHDATQYVQDLPASQIAEEASDVSTESDILERTPVNWRAASVAFALLALAATFFVWVEFFAEPTTSAGYTKPGDRYYVRGEYKSAIDCYSAALLIEYHDPYTHTARGNARFMLENYEKAIDDYSVALSLYPESLVYLNRGNCWYLQQEYELALADFESALELNDRHAETHNAIAWLLATCPDSKFRNGTLAIEHASRAYELEPSPAWYDLGTLAAAHAEAGDFEAAVKWQRAAIAKAPPEEVSECRDSLELYLLGQPRRDPDASL
ncbi:MAG TPA: tetratricopeptide repeat protein [Pirellulaceae bacterium]|nr:tetratricopeptide repeat protein [Pirellulaceae bacterium]